MKKFHVVALLLVSVGILLPALASGDHEHPAVTIQGEVLDMACYVAHGATGDDHAGCAKKCVKGGQPMGLLATDGTVYLLYADHADSTAYDETKEFAGQKVEISGKTATKAGIKGVEVQSVRAI